MHGGVQRTPDSPVIMFSLKSAALVICLTSSPAFADSGNNGSGNTNGSSGNGSGNTTTITINIGCILCGGGSGTTEAKGWHPPMISQLISPK